MNNGKNIYILLNLPKFTTGLLIPVLRALSAAIEDLLGGIILKDCCCIFTYDSIPLLTAFGGVIGREAEVDVKEFCDSESFTCPLKRKKKKKKFQFSLKKF